MLYRLPNWICQNYAPHRSCWSLLAITLFLYQSQRWNESNLSAKDSPWRPKFELIGTFSVFGTFDYLCLDWYTKEFRKGYLRKYSRILLFWHITKKYWPWKYKDFGNNAKICPLNEKRKRILLDKWSLLTSKITSGT